MSVYYRMLCRMYNADEPFTQGVTNTIYFKDNGLESEPESLVEDLAQIYVDHTEIGSGFGKIEVRAYSMEDPTPRVIKAQHIADLTARQGSPGPREVALCLSYYSEFNRPRRRGRLFMGPFSNNRMTDRPDAALRTLITNFGNNLATLGGIDVDWSVYSPTTDAGGASLDDSWHPVSHTWVDDAWDTVRSRGHIPTTRTNNTPGP